MRADEYPFYVTIDVVFRDVDAMGHVNHAVYFTYMETARIRYLTELFGVSELRKLPVIVGEASCSYKSPAFFGEKLILGLGISRFGTKSFDLLYRIETDDGRLVAIGKTVQVMYDYDAERTIAVPADLRERVAARQGAWEPADV